MSGRVKRSLCYECWEFHNTLVVCGEDTEAVKLMYRGGKRGTQMHYLRPNKSLDDATDGVYKQGECKSVVDPKWVTEDKDKVQCYQCKRTHRFRGILDKAAHEREMYLKRKAKRRPSDA